MVPAFSRFGLFTPKKLFILCHRNLMSKRISTQQATTNGAVIWSEFDPILNSTTFRETGFATPVSVLVARMTQNPVSKCTEFVVKGKVADVFLGPLPLLRYKWSE